MALSRHKTVRQALQAVEDSPDWPNDSFEARIEMPVHEMVARNLFDIANHPDPKNQASVNRSLRAQKIILDRLTGTRRMGTHPAVRNQKRVRILDMTQVGSDDE
uniref:Terminase small subunit n=1 Tax=Microbacterium phage RicoCaldo TaxID=3230836 RepID=A0AAU8EGM6_9CAUD